MLQAQVYQAKSTPGDAQGASRSLCGDSMRQEQGGDARVQGYHEPGVVRDVWRWSCPRCRRRGPRSNPRSRPGWASRMTRATRRRTKTRRTSSRRRHMSMAQANARGIHPGANRLPQGGFEGIAWWAVPKMTVIVFDHARACWAPQRRAVRLLVAKSTPTQAEEAGQVW